MDKKQQVQSKKSIKKSLKVNSSKTLGNFYYSASEIKFDW